MNPEMITELAHKAAVEIARIAASQVVLHGNAAKRFIKVYDETFEHIKKKLKGD